MVTETPNFFTCVVEQPQTLSKERNLNSLRSPTFDNELQDLAWVYRGNYSVLGWKKDDFPILGYQNTLTIEDIKDYLDCIETCGMRKKHPDHYILLLDRPTSLKLKNMLLLVDTDWLDTQSVPLMRFFEKWGHDNYFRKSLNEFYNHSTSIRT